MGYGVVLADGTEYQKGTQSHLKDAWDKFINPILTSGAGKVIMTVLTVAAIALAVMLIAALVLKAMGRQNQLVQTMAPDGKHIAAEVLFILLLTAPLFLLPLILTVIDTLVNALQDPTKNLLNNTTALPGIMLMFPRLIPFLPSLWPWCAVYEDYVGEHPRDTMDDLTEVSCPSSMEKVNTIRLTKGTEIRSKTFLSILFGMGVGAVLMGVFWGLLGTYGAAFIVLGGVLAPVFIVGTVKDQTRQLRWRRAFNSIRSSKVEGRVFFPNSLHPENVTRLEVLVMRP